MSAAGAMKLTVQSRGQVTLPRKMREDMHLEPGDTVIAVPEGDGAYRLERFERMSLEEIYARWADSTPRPVEEVERMIQEAREDFANELAREYGE